MSRIGLFLLLLALSAAALPAQTTGTRTIQANGTATQTANPDQAQLEVGVVTLGATAQESAQQNATQTTAVLNAVKAVLGANGTVQTVSYSVYARYNNAQPSVIIGYTTTNMVRVTTTDLSIVGKLIDAANQAGANSVGGLSFGLLDPEPLVERALSAATKQALAHAGAIAAGLGGKVGAVLSAQEGVSYTPLPVAGAGIAAAPTTPVQTGTVTVYASVTINVQLQ